ncbi:hypothetical protein DTB58_28235, partial [Streptomyces griseus]|nr:hypothetical protein [Streptomyces griseus]
AAVGRAHSPAPRRPAPRRPAPGRSAPRSPAPRRPAGAAVAPAGRRVGENRGDARTGATVAGADGTTARREAASGARPGRRAGPVRGTGR